MSNPSSPPFPIDAVFTWVDGSDPVWQQKRAGAYASFTGQEIAQEEVFEPARFQDNGELRYALRALHTHAPWIRTVHLITAGQKPVWLNTEKVHLVDHTEIFPDTAALPVFHSRPIEFCMHNTPGLAEHFLYFNDDFMLGNTVHPSDFFLPDGTPRIWAAKRSTRSIQRILHKTHTSTHSASFSASYRLIQQHFKSLPHVAVRHTPKVMTKSTTAQVLDTFPTETAATICAPFFAFNQIDIAILYPLFLLATKQGVLRPINGLQQILDLCKGRPSHFGASVGDRNLKRKIFMIKWLKPLTFCLNDSPGSLPKDKERVQHLYHSYYPNPSPFEILDTQDER